MKNIMVDLETLGTAADSVIIAIGAVEFSSDGVSNNTFYINVDPEDCQKHGLTISAATVLWWLGPKVTNEARMAIVEPKKTSLKESLTNFTDWASHGTNSPKDITVWGNGSDFDNVLLAHAYEKIGLKEPWYYGNNRCYRTVKNLWPKVEMKERLGHHHNALDDAKSQANHLLELLKVGKITI